MKEYKTRWIGDYKIAIDTCDNDVPYVIVMKQLEDDKVENIFGYYGKDVVDFFLTIITKLNQQAQRISELEEQLKMEFCENLSENGWNFVKTISLQ